MEMTVVFSGGKKIDAQIGKHVIKTDQPRKEGGEGTAPAPFAYCLASMGTCAALYVYKYLESRDLPLDQEARQGDPDHRASPRPGREAPQAHHPVGVPVRGEEALRESPGIRNPD